jgi:hypothetical protein
MTAASRERERSQRRAYPEVVADPYQCPFLRIAWFADFAGVRSPFTHVQWLYAVHPWFPVSAADVSGSQKEVCYVRS